MSDNPYGSVPSNQVPSSPFPSMDVALTEQVRKHQLAVEGLTESQFVSVLKQMLASGDFMRNVTNVKLLDKKEILDCAMTYRCAISNKLDFTHSQSVTYVPFRETEALRERVRELETALGSIRTALERADHAQSQSEEQSAS